MTGHEVHADRKFYYVSVIDGSRRALLAGPYTDHRDALAKVDTVRKLADDVDPRACFYAFGTAGSDEQHHTRFGVV